MFPSTIEPLLWKSSYFVLLGSAALVIAWIIITFTYIFIIELWAGSNPLTTLKPSNTKTFGPKEGAKEASTYEALLHFLPKLLTIMLYLLAFTWIVLYIAARVYIVIESYVSLRHVPIGVYETPHLNIMNYVPHL
ncbi:hypothetical protein BDZ45DRAFT_739785 [Acephala macrosclerotiorum]|nr:hypothetical protein BDZ45DRAFT_739785 [Acephala macrosclerotiorum]